MTRSAVVIVLMMLLACACTCADLMFVAKSEYELREVGTPPHGVELGDDAEAPREQSLPEMVDRVVNADDMPLQWLKVWMVDGKWRRDTFEQDPRSGCEPVLSVIRLEELGQTITLDWQERIAEISDDATIAQWEEQMSQQEQHALQESAQMPEELIQQLPPELQQQLRERLAEMRQPAEQAQDDPAPVVTIEVEGPLGSETILGLGCTKYKFTIETHQALPHGPWGHTREQTWVLLTNQLTLPQSEQNPWEWRGAMAAVGCDEAWEQATEGMDIPGGFAMKRYTIQEDLFTGAVGVLQGELLQYDDAAIAPSIFDIPDGFTRQEMQLPAIGEPEAEQVQP